MRPSASWAIDSEPIRAQGIIVNYFPEYCFSTVISYISGLHKKILEKNILTEFFENFFPKTVKAVHQSLQVFRHGRYFKSKLGNDLAICSILALGCWSATVEISFD